MGTNQTNILTGAFTYIAVISMFSIMLFLVLHTWANTPEMYKSYSSGDCIKVVEFTEEKQYSCSNQPVKYTLIYVE